MLYAENNIADNLKFNKFYDDELDNSFIIINKFAQSRDLYINYKTWKNFCYKHSDLYELQDG
jgi:hypothetical protein